MCIVAAKYFPEVGFVLFKNRDRNYKPGIRIRKSWRRGIERMYIWDQRTKYTEGVNEYGVGIISASVLVKDDETEGNQAGGGSEGKVDRTYYSPDGLRIRTALFETDAVSATKRLIELQIPGNTIIADRERCFVLEATFDKSEDGSEKYIYKAKEVPQGHIVVRTNHGIMLPWTGYSKDIPDQKASRNSSEIRYKKSVKTLLAAKTIQEVLDGLSDRSDSNPQLNPLRNDSTRGSMRTTGQIVIVPSECTLYYRQVWCDLSFDMESLNKSGEKTFFEVISNRKLLTFKENLNLRRK